MKFSRYTLKHKISLCFRGDNEIRTRDPLLARQVLSQLSYTPGLFVFQVVLFSFFIELSPNIPPLCSAFVFTRLHEVS